MRENSRHLVDVNKMFRLRRARIEGVTKSDTLDGEGCCLKLHPHFSIGWTERQNVAELRTRSRNVIELHCVKRRVISAAPDKVCMAGGIPVKGVA